MGCQAATRTGVVIAGISSIPVRIGSVISAWIDRSACGLMNAGAATRIRIVITGIASGVVRIRGAISPGAHRAGGGRVGRAATAGIGVVIAGIAGVMFRIRSVVSPRIDGSTCAYRRHRSGTPEFTRPPGGRHARHAMIDGSEL